MISRDLKFLAWAIRSRIFDPLSAAELLQVADILESMLPQVEAMEDSAVPLCWRDMENR